MLDHGRLVVQSSVADLVASAGERVHVASPRARELRGLLEAGGARVLDGPSDEAFVVNDRSAAAVGDLAAGAGIALHELRTEIQSLEEIFLQLTTDEGRTVPATVQRPDDDLDPTIDFTVFEATIDPNYRIDEIRVGSRFASRFWVYGRFTVRDGQIAIWRDHFDWFDITAGIARGLLGLAAPSLNRKMPT